MHPYAAIIVAKMYIERTVNFPYSENSSFATFSLSVFSMFDETSNFTCESDTSFSSVIGSEVFFV